MQTFISRLMPFLVFGMMIVILIFGFMLFFYLLIFGAIVGLCLFVITWIREKFFPAKHKPMEKTGRIIEHDSDNN